MERVPYEISKFSGVLQEARTKKKTWDIRRRCHLLQVAGIHTAADFDRWGNVKTVRVEFG